MKKLLILPLITLLAALSCTKELPTEISSTPDTDLMTFIATVDGSSTKTAVGTDEADKVIPVWNGVETIRLYDGAGSKDFSSEEVSMVASATFTEVPTDPKVEFTGADYLAAYPLMAYGGAGREGYAMKHLWLKDNQAATSGSFDPEAHVMVAYAEAGAEAISFMNTVALLKVSVGNENVSEISFAGNNNETIAGNFDVVDINTAPAVEVYETVPENYLYCKKVSLGGEIQKDAAYYMAVLPSNFTTGFTLNVTIDGVTYIKSTPKPYDVQRNNVLDLKTVSFALSSREMYFKPAAGGTAEGEWYAAWVWGDGVADRWYLMEDADGDGVYECSLASQFANAKFFKMSATDTEPNYNEGVTGDLVLPTEDYENNNCYVKEADLDGKDCWMSVADARNYTSEVPKTILYLQPNSNWNVDNARFAAYFFGNGETWSSMTDADGDGIYEVEAPNGYPSVIFCRMNPATTVNNWDNKWNQTSDLVVPSDGTNLYIVEEGTWDKGNGTWSTYQAK